MCCTCFTDALDEPSNKSIERQQQEEFYATSLGYLAEQFESDSVNITQRLHQLDHSSDDFVSDLYEKEADIEPRSQSLSSSHSLEQER